jgi:hypothetical protein
MYDDVISQINKDAKMHFGESKNSKLLLIGGAGCLILIGIILVYLHLQKKKEEEKVKNQI